MSEMMSGTSMRTFGPVMMVVCAALIIVPFWFIFRRAGHSPWLSLLMVVPLANVVMLYFLAFSDWPRLRDVEAKQG